MIVVFLHHVQNSGNTERTVPGNTRTFVGFPHLGQMMYPLLFTFTVSSSYVVAEQAGVEPTRQHPPTNGLAIRCRTCYAYCSICPVHPGDLP